MTRRWLPILLILIGGWGLLEALSYQAGLGDYARSPQRLQLKQGLTAIVAGGNAGVVFMEDRFRKRAQLIVRCKEGRHTINLRRGQVSEEVCGIHVELLEILTGKVNVEVSWGPDAGVPSGERTKEKEPTDETPEKDAREAPGENTPPPAPEASEGPAR